ncbi:LysR family transcriptional regulator [Amycolatopsis pithecellobii]|uniref:LysR family transcriptional regulator n=1 Tax=Amycolatopsis pithecellobii TaxID=664692 RepID=A0A6N7Z321_9PSEU|nr:LysR family transcriptional regulator [Amycolatopsis pithecellobii]MTD54551.1 LysR family transcriptional regulator [Amycolatopsis pithecellobii]
MKLGQLRSFLSVAEHGSIRGAARALGVTQPAVTQAMRELETSLGVPLLHRGPAGVELTVYGKALARRAGLIHREIEQAVSEIDQIRDGSTGHVSVALSTAVALQLLPGAFGSFRAQFPSVELRLNEASVPNTLPRLLDGSVDFAVSHLLPGSLSGWKVERLFTMSMVVAARTGHPVLAATDTRQFTDWEWLLPYDDDSAPDLVQQLFAQMRIPLPRQVVRCTSSAMGLKLVGTSDLIGVFADTMVDVEFPHYGIIQVPLNGPLAALDVSIITRPGAILSPAAQNFLDFLRAQVQRA